MDIRAQKLLLIEQLLRVQDINVLAQVRELLKKSHDPIVGYEADGKPVTHHDFIRSVEEAEAEYKAGNHQTPDEVEKESESW